MRTKKEHLKMLIKNAYAIQRQRKTTEDRIRTIYGHLPPRYKDGYIEAKTGNEIIDNLIEQRNRLLEIEKQAFYQIESIVENEPINKVFFSRIVDLDLSIVGILLSEFEIHKAPHPSSLWAYAGLDVAKDGKARSVRKEHLVWNPQTKKYQATHNRFLKTRLLTEIADNLINSTSEYAKIYGQHKFRLYRNPRHKCKSKLHIHNMAKRYMIKCFLLDLYKHWRKLEGLPVANEYWKEFGNKQAA
jgi:hypothetical protein